MTPQARAGIAAAVLVVPVALQLAVPDLADRAWAELVFAGSQIVGWMLLVTVCRDLRAARPPATRAARVGHRVLVAGCVAEVAFATAYVALVVAGSRPDGAFVLFLLAFLLLTVGGLTRGISLARHDAGDPGWALIAVAVLGALAIAIPTALHDVFLLGSYLAWVLVGRAVQAGAARPTQSRAARSVRSVVGGGL